jgi:hypothetical protein
MTPISDIFRYVFAVVLTLTIIGRCEFVDAQSSESKVAASRAREVHISQNHFLKFQRSAARRRPVGSSGNNREIP